MKIFTLFLMFLPWSPMHVGQDRGASILNPAIIETVNDEEIYYFYQGQTIIVALDDDLKKSSLLFWIRGPLFGDVYKFNSRGFALIGLGMRMGPGEYSLCLNLKCDEMSRKSKLRIRVIETKFIKTRISAYSGEPQPRRDKQKNLIEKAYEQNMSDEDLAGGSAYIDPLDIPRDIIDPFGLIYKNNEYRTHGGVDLRVKVGTPVRAVNRGKIVLAAKMFRKEGNMIIINHGLGIFSVYMHLSRFGQIETPVNTKGGKNVQKKRQLQPGDVVEGGQIIGLSGRTGAGVREPHLHLNIRIKDAYVDPFYFIDTINQHVK